MVAENFACLQSGIRERFSELHLLTSVTHIFCFGSDSANTKEGARDSLAAEQGWTSGQNLSPSPEAASAHVRICRHFKRSLDTGVKVRHSCSGQAFLRLPPVTLYYWPGSAAKENKNRARCFDFPGQPRERGTGR